MKRVNCCVADEPRKREDVVTDGGYVQAGARVRVIEVEGNRIVVKEV